MTEIPCTITRTDKHPYRTNGYLLDISYLIDVHWMSVKYFVLYRYRLIKKKIVVPVSFLPLIIHTHTHIQTHARAHTHTHTSIHLTVNI